MTTAAPQHLRVLPGRYVIEHTADEHRALSTPWLCLTRAPEGLTVVRETTTPKPPTDPDGTEYWAALYSGDTAHGLDVVGMLASLLTPLAAAGVPVFVASTRDADLILVPEDRLADTARALRTAGHLVDL
ncbi:ACT domain-containing protein [Streptomyces sp. NPDC088387]|uniref:ACT domain-containing protein n=1 Tax=Streptomyces sp. NPDC088387 TaxID=3365859 RepID=UPI0038249A20